MPLANFHPLIRQWFEERFAAPTEAQRLGWPAIQNGRDTLIAAPTGSGKTLDRVPGQPRPAAAAGPGRRAARPDLRRLRLAAAGPVERHPAQPAGAAGRDPGAGPRRSSPTARRSAPWSAPATRRPASGSRWSAGRRTSSSPRPSRSTWCSPASAAGRSCGSVETVIVDEIHAVARDKRGSHLALSLERLEALCAQRGRFASACPRRRSRSTSWPGSWSASARAAPPADRRRRPLPRHGPGRRSAAAGAAGRLHARALGRSLRAAGAADRRASQHADLRQHAQAGRARRPSADGAARRGPGAVASRQPVAPQPAADRSSGSRRAA